MRNRDQKILGIDPGYDRVGIAIVEKEKLIYSECFETNRNDLFEDRLLAISKKIENIIKEFSPQALAIETLFLNNNQKTAMRVAEARGVIIVEARKNGLEISELSPLEVKVAITGYGKSDKKQIQNMVTRLVKIEKKKILDDEYDAIAIALTGAVSYPQR
jgi:crossover junction endodeoxyribonuclease RuvC